MRVGVVETLGHVHRLGRAMHPSITLNSFKHQVILILLTLKSLPEIRKWYENSDNPLLARALKRFPLISGAIYWPYINHAWSMKQRLATIDQHYYMLGGPAAIIAHATFEKVELARLDDSYAGLHLALDKAEWFLREGEIVLNLFVNDQRIYSIAFTLGIEAGQPLIFVGALQGVKSEAARGLYRDITHALHGMRPRDFLMGALKLTCAELDIRRIWAVSGEYRQHNSSYFGDSHKEKVLVAYDEVWLEQGGLELDNGFFEIPTIISRKDTEEIPARKRATYKRRFQMLDKLALDIKTTLAQHAAL
ncbi:MAG: VirK/YbjX family protein [Gammaproteobacteria bacterium]|nr:VirK/YbjX family protein [Gammaproteobacteria bacterium]MBU1775611.1 VirK/YbjX family protein [Gammaproteobacteria bacterium]MBU1969732.1 VirK/YbjX family protein [Gammaproteobacteria bacterium]